MVRASYLDHAGSRPGQVLRALEAAGHRRAVVVPLLLTAAYHGRVDIPGAIAAARAAGLRMPVRVTGVLGPADGVVHELLLAGLLRRLTETGHYPGARGGAGDADAIVLAAAGTRNAAARRTVEVAADTLGASRGVPCLAAYASADPPTAGEAVARLRAAGARRVVVAAYFLAPGRLYEVAARSARAAGAVAVAAPLGDATELARLVLTRVAAEAAAQFPARADARSTAA
jgi:sirohydrochlorin ferrochelatase